MPSSMRYQVPVAGSTRRPEITSSLLTSIGSSARPAPLTGALRRSTVFILINQDFSECKQLFEHLPRVQGRYRRFSTAPLHRINRNNSKTRAPLPQAISDLGINKPSIGSQRKIQYHRATIKLERRIRRIPGLAQEQSAEPGVAMRLQSAKDTAVIAAAYAEDC